MSLCTHHALSACLSHSAYPQAHALCNTWLCSIVLSTSCYTSVPTEVFLPSKSSVREQAMKSFSLVCLAAVVAVIASSNGVQADTPVAGTGDGTRAEKGEVIVTFDCFLGGTKVGAATVALWATQAQAAAVCNANFPATCFGGCYAT